MSVPVATNVAAQWDDGRIQPRSAETIAWQDARALLAGSHSYWFATAARGSRPHVRPVLGVLIDDTWCSTSSPVAAKYRNLVRTAEVTVATTVPGMDLVIEGVASPVRDAPMLDRIAAAYHEKYGWPVQVDGDAFNAPYGAPTAGPPPYAPYRVVPVRAFAFGTDEQRGPRTTRYLF